MKAKPVGMEETHRSAGLGETGIAAARFYSSASGKSLDFILTGVEGCGRFLTEGGMT